MTSQAQAPERTADDYLQVAKDMKELLDVINFKPASPEDRINILCMGMQHQGKSAFSNTVFHVVKDLPEFLAGGNPADSVSEINARPKFRNRFACSASNAEEKTRHYDGKYLTEGINFFDGGAIHTCSEEVTNAIGCMLQGVSTGALREEYKLYPDPRNKIDVVIMVCSAVSVLSDESQAHQVNSQIATLLGQYDIPYVVALTMVDQIDSMTSAVGRSYSLEEAKTQARRCSNSSDAHAIVNYTEENICQRRPFETELPLLTLLYQAVMIVQTKKMRVPSTMKVKVPASFSGGMDAFKMAAFMLAFCCVLFLLFIKHTKTSMGRAVPQSDLF